MGGNRGRAALDETWSPRLWVGRAGAEPPQSTAPPPPGPQCPLASVPPRLSPAAAPHNRPKVALPVGLLTSPSPSPSHPHPRTAVHGALMVTWVLISSHQRRGWRGKAQPPCWRWAALGQRGPPLLPSCFQRWPWALEDEPERGRTSRQASDWLSRGFRATGCEVEVLPQAAGTAGMGSGRTWALGGVCRHGHAREPGAWAPAGVGVLPGSARHQVIHLLAFNFSCWATDVKVVPHPRVSDTKVTRSPVLRGTWMWGGGTWTQGGGTDMG